ncbi:hypothetical protein D3C71_1421930 [compost metagenome]
MHHMLRVRPDRSLGQPGNQADPPAGRFSLQSAHRLLKQRLKLHHLRMGFEVVNIHRGELQRLLDKPV